MCLTTTSTATSSCVYEGNTSSVNTKYAYLNISVWSNAKSAGASDLWSATASDFYVQFHASEWEDGSTYYTVEPALAVGLSEVASAIALSASAVSAAAVGISLY